MAEEEPIFEEGHSFVPDSLLVAEEAKVRPTAVDDTAAATRKGALSALDVPIKEPTEDERREQFTFEKAFDALCENQSHMLPEKYREMLNTIRAEYLSKQTKYEIFRGQLRNAMAKYGVVRISGSASVQDRMHTGSEIGWMIRLGDFLEAAKAYFGDIMPDNEYDYFWRKYIGELALASFVQDKGKSKIIFLGNATELDKRMEKIRDVARRHGTITKAQVATFEKQAKIAITGIIIDKITAEFYERPGIITGGTDKETIISLARKYGIDIPSEQDFWKEEAKRLIAELEAVVIEIESEKDEHNFKYSIKNREKRISALRDSLIAGKGKFGDDIFPEDTRPFDEWMVGMTTRIETAKRHNLEFLYQDQETKLTAALEGVMESMNVDEARKQFGFFSDFLNEIKTDAARNDRITEALRGYLRRIDERISALTQEIQADATRAKVNGKKLTILGNLREIFAENIQK